MKKKILCLLLALLVINLSIPHVAWATAEEQPTSGNCGAEGDGSNVIWNLDSDGTLTISGSGKMKDYNSTDKAPWYGHIKNIKSVTIAPDVTSIGNYAFYNCTNLQPVTIPGSVTSIGKCAFAYCLNLPSVTIPEKVTSIEESTFLDCHSLQSVTIPGNVNSIRNWVFAHCDKLESVTIPEKVTSIGKGVFKDCTGLTSVTIPEKVTSIEDETFFNCSSLQSVTIPATVTEIGNSVFERCNNLETVFYNNEGPNIESAGIPDKTAKIGYKMHGQQDGPRTKVKLVSTSKDVTIECNAMGEGYEITENNTTEENKKVTIEHTWDDGIDTTEPTCTAEGSKRFKCTVCGETKEETIKAAGHTFSEAWNNDNTYHWHECSVCHEKQNEGRHTFEQKSGEGKHWEECNVCHKKQNEGQHTFEQKSNEDEHWEECTTCKQEQNRNDHTFSQEWSSDGTHHWHACECGARQDEGQHDSNWEHNSAEHWKVCSICKKETDKALHSFSKVIFDPTEDKLGGTKCTCTDCGYEYWKNFERGNMTTQTLMPNEETIYHYCTHNGLAAETTVDVGGKKLAVFLLDPLRVLKKNDSDFFGISVTYIKEGSARYDELMSQLDGDYPIEHINFFEVHPTINGKAKEGAIDSVYMMYEIPEGWDESDLEMILVRDGDDQEFDEKVLEINGKKYLAMWKNHFSPYAMIDKLTDEERAALIAQQVESMGSANSSGSTDGSKYLANQVKTGDNSKNMVLMSTAMLITSGLFLEICIKRKRFCYTILTD